MPETRAPSAVQQSCPSAPQSAATATQTGTPPHEDCNSLPPQPLAGGGTSSGALHPAITTISIKTLIPLTLRTMGLAVNRPQG